MATDLQLHSRCWMGKTAYTAARPHGRRPQSAAMPRFIAFGHWMPSTPKAS